MKTSFRLLLCLCLTLFASAEAHSQNYEQTFDALLTAQLSTESPGVAALVVKDGKTLYKKSFGVADLELDVAMKPDHVFRIGSITKQFTACAIMQLAEQGRLSLQDSITRYIKDYPAQGHTITIEHLLTHTSGIKNLTGMPAWTPEVRRKDFNPKELVDFFKNEPMDFTPGSAYRYSNSNYVLLGYIIELITGSTYSEYLDKNFFQPLGMTSTSYDNSLEIIANRAKGYQKIDGRYKHADFLSMTQPFSAGAIVSNTGDLYTWYNAVMNYKVVSKKSLEKAQAPFTLSDGKLTAYGYGWELGNIQGSPVIRHGGRINGFITSSVYLREEKVFVAIFSNCDCTTNMENKASEIAAVAIGKPYAWPSVQLTVKELKRYEGVYESETKDERIVSFEDGRLVYFSRKGLKSQIFPFEKDGFHIENSLATIHFTKDKNEKINAFILKSTERPVTWVRTEKEVTKIKEIRVAPEKLDQYVGKYQFGPGYFMITKDEGKLYGTAPGNNQVRQEIVPFGNHKFFARNIDAQIIFNVDENGKVIGFTLIQHGENKAPRID